MAPIIPNQAQTGTTVSGVPATDPNLLLGAPEIGIFISMILFGVLMMQGGTYWKQRGHDSNNRKLQAMVAVILILEFGHSIACIGTVYYFTVTLSIQAIRPGTCYSFSIALVFGIFIVALVQIFYFYRCYIFSKNFILSLIGYILVAVEVACTLWITYESWLAATDPNPFKMQTDFDWLITMALGGKAVVDVYAAGSLCWYLKGTLEAQPLESTVKIVKRILFWTIETDLATSVTSIIALVCFQLMKFNYVWVAVYLSLTKLYSISLIASLNRRTMYRAQYPAVEIVSTLSQSIIRFKPKDSTVLSSRVSSGADSVPFVTRRRRWTDGPSRVVPPKSTTSVTRRSTVSL